LPRGVEHAFEHRTFDADRDRVRTRIMPVRDEPADAVEVCSATMKTTDLLRRDSREGSFPDRGRLDAPSTGRRRAGIG